MGGSKIQGGRCEASEKTANCGISCCRKYDVRWNLRIQAPQMCIRKVILTMLSFISEIQVENFPSMHYSSGNCPASGSVGIVGESGGNPRRNRKDLFCSDWTFFMLIAHVWSTGNEYCSKPFTREFCNLSMKYDDLPQDLLVKQRIWQLLDVGCPCQVPAKSESQKCALGSIRDQFSCKD